MAKWTVWLDATISELGSPDNDIAREAEGRLIQSIKRRLHAHREMVDRLSKATHRPDPQMRWRAAYALAATHDSRAYPRLAELANDADPDVRYEVACAFGTFGYPEAVELLINLVSQAPREDCADSAAAMSLQYLGRPAVAPLIELLSHESPEVRVQATDVLGYIGADDAIAPLTALLDRAAGRERDMVLEALADIRAGGRGARQ